MSCGQRQCLPHLLASDDPRVLTLSPPLNLSPHWLGRFPGYMLAKYGMTLATLGFAAEYQDGPWQVTPPTWRRDVQGPADLVEAIAPTTGWSGSEDQLAEQLRAFEAIGCDEIHLIPTSSDVDQLRRAAEVAKDFA